MTLFYFRNLCTLFDAKFVLFVFILSRSLMNHQLLKEANIFREGIVALLLNDDPVINFNRKWFSIDRPSVCDGSLLTRHRRLRIALLRRARVWSDRVRSSSKTAQRTMASAVTPSS